MKPSWHDPARWAALVDGSGCPFCTGEGPAHVVAELDECYVTTSPDVDIRGYCCVIPRTHAVELHDLDDDTAAAVMRELRLVAAAVQRITGATKLNYEIHGNVVPHVHVHIVPRHRGDAMEDGQRFQHVRDAGYDGTQRADFARELRRALAAGPGARA